MDQKWTICGPTPNLVLKSQIDKFYEDKDESCPWTLRSWLLFGAPMSLVIVLLSWVWLQFYFFRCSGISNCAGKPTDVSIVRLVLQQQYKQLGKLNFGQIAVGGHFVALATLWITRDLGGSFGWAQLFQKKFVKDSVPALLVGCSLFIFPSAVPKVFNCGRNEQKSIPVRPLLLWDEFNKKMPWGVVFLLGGGFSIAKTSQVKAGSMLNIIAVITLIVANETLGRQLFYNSLKLFSVVGNQTHVNDTGISNVNL